MKTVSTLRRILTTTATAAAGTVFALAGFVGTTNADVATQSYQISPPTANYAANPGASVTGSMKVTNLTGSPMTINVGKENFVAKGEEGEIELTDNADPLYSLAPWFSFDAAQLNVPPRSTVSLGYTIAVPANAEPGGRYGSITFNTIPPKLPNGQSGAAVEQNLAGIVFLRINGAAKEQVSVDTFETGIYTAKTSDFLPKTFFEYGPVDFLTRVQNNGNVHEKPTGQITIKNMFGATVAVIPLDQHFVIPGAIRRLHNTWTAPKHSLLIGSYSAHLVATYATGKTLTADTSFLVLPWRLLLIVLVIVVLVFLFFWKGRKRLARAVRILAGKE